MSRRSAATSSHKWSRTSGSGKESQFSDGSSGSGSSERRLSREESTLGLWRQVGGVGGFHAISRGDNEGTSVFNSQPLYCNDRLYVQRLDEEKRWR